MAFFYGPEEYYKYYTQGVKSGDLIKTATLKMYLAGWNHYPEGQIRQALHLYIVGDDGAVPLDMALPEPVKNLTDDPICHVSVVSYFFLSMKTLICIIKFLHYIWHNAVELENEWDAHFIFTRSGYRVAGVRMTEMERYANQNEAIKQLQDILNAPDSHWATLLTKLGIQRPSSLKPREFCTLPSLHLGQYNSPVTLYAPTS